MKKQEREHHIKVFKQVLVEIDEDDEPFICIALNEVKDSSKTLEYFKSQKPTNSKNKEFFKGFETSDFDVAWWASIHTAEERFKQIRRDFINHLIKKLEK